MSHGYKDLVVWQVSMDLVTLCYSICSGFPESEKYVLTSQLLRSAISIPSNIAEGKARRSEKEYHHHLSIAYGSLAELETQLQISFRLGYCPRSDYEKALSECDRVAMMLNKLIAFLGTD